MDVYSNFLFVSGAVLVNLVICLSLAYSAFKAWIWLTGEIRSVSTATNLRMEMLCKKIGELERKS